MKEVPLTDALVRQFLLGEVDEEERERIERLFITDRLSKDRVLCVEQALIEDYLKNSLTAADRERFLLHYAQTPLQKRKLRIAKAVEDWVTTGANVTQPVTPSTTSIWSQLRARVKPTFIIPTAVSAAIVALVVGTVWINRTTKRRNIEHQAIEQELSRLNAPSSAHEIPSQVVSLDLVPITVRSVARPSELVIRADIRVVELRLLWIQREHYATYQAVVRRLGDDESFTASDLKAENEGKAIRLRLPAQLFARGAYQIELTGITTEGTSSPVEEYNFTVGR